MSAINPSTSNSVAQSFSSAEQAGRLSDSGNNEGYNSLGTDDFLKLLVQELQNQDPLDPMDNSEMVQQIGQIREIGATDELTSTLTGLSNNQQLVTASGLIGQKVQGLGDDQSNVDGVVDQITVTTNNENNVRSVKVHVGGKTMDVENIRQITPG